MADATALVQQLERLRSIVLTRVADVDARTLHTLADAVDRHVAVLPADEPDPQRGGARSAPRRLPGRRRRRRRRELSVAGAARVVAALVRVRPHVDRPDGLVDGQPAEPTVQAVVVDGVLGLVCQARGGLADDDPLLLGLVEDLLRIASSRGSELSR